MDIERIKELPTEALMNLATDLVEENVENHQMIKAGVVRGTLEIAYVRREMLRNENDRAAIEAEIARRLA